jgi:hypothetical protein
MASELVSEVAELATNVIPPEAGVLEGDDVAVAV